MSPPAPFHSLAPTLLLSMPQLVDPNFRRTVVLLCEHGTEGALGFVLNRPTDTPASAVVKLDPPARGDSGLSVWVGGPVDPQRGWILLGHEPTGIESVQICDGIYLSTSADLLRRFLQSPPPARARLLTGYAGWGPGQLDAEIASSSWLTADIELDLVFDTPASEMWEEAIRRLGADPATLQMGGGIH